MNQLKSLIVKNTLFLRKNVEIVLIFLLFLVTRLPSLFAPYHQDEYKWARIADYTNGMAGTIPHPPMSEFLYHIAGFVTGYANLRYLPLFFSIAVFFLLYLVVKRFIDKNTALWSCFIFSLIPYSVLASLQIDIDGAFLPFWTLLLFLGYSMVREKGIKYRKGLLIIVVALVGGILSKLSFVLAPLVVLTHFVYERFDDDGGTILKKFLNWKIITSVCVFLFLLLLVYARFSSEIFFLRYVRNFTGLSGRNFGQFFFLTAKAFIYLSPVLVFASIFAIKYFKKLSLWYFFAIYGVLFYGVVFDFTTRTLDRYWMILIIPFSVILAYFISILVDFDKKNIFRILSMSAVFLLCGLLFSVIKHNLIPLNPKSAFIEAVIGLNWNILIPLTGGSGPLGFYVSFILVAVFSFVSLVLFSVFIFSRNIIIQKTLLLTIISVFSAYSLVLIGEYHFGMQFGSTAKVLNLLTKKIESTDNIEKVITYNDIGAYELHDLNKYHKRFYADPAFVEDNKKKFDEFAGYFMILDFPHINTNSFYANYLFSCAPVYEYRDKFISGKILNCSNRNDK